ncbi:MAG: SH3 domain-containing protein, partial [Victivallales bacterium]|nr:SH3 domain-containing protein [Victivallales bacterium]
GVWYYSAVLTAAATICLIAVFSQYRSTYADNQGVVISKRAQVYNLPSENSGYAGLKLRYGEKVSIEEERPDWIRIKAENVEGWVPAAEVAAIWGNATAAELDKICR